MPNWCENSLSVSGNYKDLESLFENAKKVGLFESIIPIGEWDYSLAIDSWGTKWDVDFQESSDLEKDEDGINGTLYLSFDSAWGPPINVIKKLAETYIIDGYFMESGMEFCGQYSNGESGEKTDFLLEEWENYTSLSEDELQSMGPDLKFMVEQEIAWSKEYDEEDSEEESEEESED